MDLDPKTCYRAMKSRDRNFDGRFFIGVSSTGIYCRPICPAPTPHARNVRFFTCAAAAEESGFRPCLRCRPETSPGTPAWAGTSATVSRGLRYVHEGFLDDHDVETLADRLGMTERHLRRLFAEHLGTTPAALAHTRRLHETRKLLRETNLSMADIAFASGFGSVRRFNDAVRRAYGAPPSSLRKQLRSRNAAAPNGAGITLHLAYRPPFDWDRLLAFFAQRAVQGVERVEGDVYRRTVSTNGSAGWIEVSDAPERFALRVAIHGDLSQYVSEIAMRVRSLFDLDADPVAISEHLSSDAILGKLVRKRPGTRVPGAWSPFEIAVRAILGQQISVQAATTIAGRIAARFGEPLAAPEQLGLNRAFPAPEQFARRRLTGLGVTKARANYIKAVAKAASSDPNLFAPLSTLEETVKKLSALPGVGPWTAHYIAMRALREPDAFLESDLGLLRAVPRNGRRITPRELRECAEAWRPWRAYGALHLWNHDAE